MYYICGSRGDEYSDNGIVVCDAVQFLCRSQHFGETCSFLLLSWRWRLYVHPKHCHPSANLQRITYQHDIKNIKWYDPYTTREKVEYGTIIKTIWILCISLIYCHESMKPTCFVDLRHGTLMNQHQLDTVSLVCLLRVNASTCFGRYSPIFRGLCTGGVWGDCVGGWCGVFRAHVNVQGSKKCQALLEQRGMDGERGKQTEVG
jgi:hypothetical protein